MGKKEVVLIYRIGSLGDSLIALPAIEKIISKHPNSQFILLTNRNYVNKNYISSWDVFGPTGYFDKVIYYEIFNLKKIKTWIEFIRFILKLRSAKPAHIYNLVVRTDEKTKCRDTVFFHTLIGVKNYVSMPIIHYPPVHNADGKLPKLEPQWKTLLDLVKANSNATDYSLLLKEENQLEASRFLQTHRLDAFSYIVICPGSKMSSKHWPEHRYIKLIEHVLDRIPSMKIVILGGVEDIDIGDRISKISPEHISNLAGKLSIFGSAAIMGKSILFIGNDSGAVHMAALLGVKTVGIYSSRDYPGLWDPYGYKNIVLRSEIDCAGCMLEICKVRKNACLELISAEAVADSVFSMLSKTLN